MRGEVEVATFTTLIYQPPELFDEFNIYLHGITPSMVQEAPRWPEVHDRLRQFADGAPLVAHNAPFDVGVLRDACDANALPWPTLRYACTLGIARQVWPGLATYSLGLLCRQLALHAEGRAHDALHDARLAARLLVRALRQSGASDLIGLIDALHMRIGELSPDSWHGSTLRPLRARDVLEAFSDHEVEPGSPFYEKNVVFTGELAMVRRVAWHLVAGCGGLPAQSVTKKTDFLVCGYQDLMRLADGDTKSQKLQRAEELRAMGSSVEILTERDFFRLLQTTAEPAIDG
jgi:DNA polymerase-3 subunit epsilon